MYGGEPEALPGCDTDFPLRRVRECALIDLGALRSSFGMLCDIGGGDVQSPGEFGSESRHLEEPISYFCSLAFWCTVPLICSCRIVERCELDLNHLVQLFLPNLLLGSIILERFPWFLSTRTSFQGCLF